MTPRYRSLTVLQQSSVEPVTLAEAKAHCRVDISTDDTYIAALVTTAREYVADYLDETIVPTQYIMRLDKFAPESIELPRPPMIASGTATAVAITYQADSSSGTATLATSQYRVDRDSKPGTVRPLYGGSWPGHLVDENSVTVTWWAGRTSVPQRTKAAMLMLVGHWYERRMAAESANMSEVPYGVKALLDSVGWGSYT